MISAFECVCYFIIHLHEVHAADGECILFRILQSANVSAMQMLFISYTVYLYIYTFEAIFEEPYTSLALLLRRYRIIVVCVCARPIPSPYLCSSSRKQIDTLIKANVCTVSVSSKLRTVLPYPYSIVHCRRIGLRDAKQHPKPYKIFLNLKHRQ